MADPSNQRVISQLNFLWSLNGFIEFFSRFFFKAFPRSLGPQLSDRSQLHPLPTWAMKSFNSWPSFFQISIASRLAKWFNPSWSALDRVDWYSEGPPHPQMKQLTLAARGAMFFEHCCWIRDSLILNTIARLQKWYHPAFVDMTVSSWWISFSAIYPHCKAARLTVVSASWTG